MEEFAQTRSPDDLFDDDFTPIDEPVIEEFVQPQPAQRGRNDRPRGRGKGRPIQQQHQPPKPPAHLSLNTPSNLSAPSTATVDTTTAESSAADPDSTPRPTTAVRGDRSATGGTAKPKLTEEELSARLAAAKLNNAKREEAHRIAEADEASFQQREAQA
ncbi:MAG: hypothetical protein L6R39_003743, partial [Caloplaca ligustica]